MDAILAGQAADGWLGPLVKDPDGQSQSSEYAVWPRFVVLKALTQWHDATGDARIVPAIGRFLRMLDALLDEQPLFEWARSRWADLVLSIHWLHERDPQGWLLDLAAKVHEQGLDWIALADDFPYTDKITLEQLHAWKRENDGLWINDNFNFTHGANVAMGLKSGDVWGRQSGEEADRSAPARLLALLDRYHGQPNGTYSCDEHLAGRHPSQGTELCAVVEMMFSLEALLMTTGDPTWAQRLEQVTYNALPATFKPDMWAHQYDQQCNQIACGVCEPRIYSTNGPEANVYGLEPNFGCCLANMHQGWPKFAASLWMRTADEGLACMSLAPCDVNAEVGDAAVHTRVEGGYPFDDHATISVTSDRAATFTVSIAIPVWAKGSTLAVDGETIHAQPGTLARIDREWSGMTQIIARLPMRFRAEPAGFDSVSLHRGPLLFAVNIPET